MSFFTELMPTENQKPGFIRIQELKFGNQFGKLLKENNRYLKKYNIKGSPKKLVVTILPKEQVLEVGDYLLFLVKRDIQNRTYSKEFEEVVYRSRK